MNLYKIVTSYEDLSNFAHYYIVASGGVEAGAVATLEIEKKYPKRKTVLKSGKVNRQKERVDEIERIASDIIVPNHIVEKLKD